MTSQRDETSHNTAGEERADDPIIIERHDEFLTGGGQAAPGGADEDATAGDELLGRPAAPDTGGMDPAPLVVPPETPRPDMSSADMGSMETGRPGPDRPEAGGPETGGPAAMPGAAASSVVDPGPATPGSAPFGAASADPAAPPSGATSSTPAAVAEPGVADTLDPSEPGLASASERDPAAGGSIPATALAEQQWPAIQAMFVDDPKGSVQRAAAAADEVVKTFVASLEREQAALRATWEQDTTTEDLRTALQQYRAFCGRLEGLA